MRTGLIVEVVHVQMYMNKERKRKLDSQ